MISRIPFLRGLSPAWMDEARLKVQRAAFEKMLKSRDIFQGRCLNAGCGEGLYADFLESFPKLTEMVHLDLQTPPSLAQRKDPRHRCVAGSLTALPFENESFDCCLCSEVLEHIQEDQQAAAELARVLKPGAWALISVPTPPAPFDPRHVREGYTLESLSTLLEENHLRVEAFAYDMHGWMRLAFRLWNWQFRVLGHDQHSYFPRVGLLALANADRLFPWGRPWDLAVLAQKTGRAGAGR